MLFVSPSRTALALILCGLMAGTARADERIVEENDPIGSLPAAPIKKPVSQSQTPEKPVPPAEPAAPVQAVPPAPAPPAQAPAAPPQTIVQTKPVQAAPAPPTIATAPVMEIPELPPPPTSVKPPVTTAIPSPTVAPPVAPLPPAPASGVFSSEALKTIAARKNLRLPLPESSIVITKSQRRLDLLSRGVLVKSYRVSLGSNPAGAKQSQGDGRTPEGRFYICTRNAANSAFHIFLGLSYPALPDAKRAVNNKQITWREYQVINQRLASRGRPPWETNLGGWVGIHGGTDGSFAQKKMQQRGSRDWTAGCIGLSNSEIVEIYAATQMGTPVTITP